MADPEAPYAENVPVVRCTWDVEVKALYVYFDGSPVSSTAKPMNVYQEDVRDDGHVIIDLALEDDAVKGAEVLAPPAPRDHVYLTEWHWFTLGRAWEQAQQTGKGVVRKDWLMPTPNVSDEGGGEA